MTSSDNSIKFFAAAFLTASLSIASGPALCQDSNSLVAVNNFPRQQGTNNQSPSAVPGSGAPTPGVQQSGSPQQQQQLDRKTEPAKKDEKFTVFEDDVTGEEEAQPNGEIDFEVTVVVPHSKQSSSRVFIYPWPVKPPVVKEVPKPLPDKPGAIRGTLLQTGYVNRSSPDWPYPAGGWRWQHAYAAAVRKSGLGLPHSIVEHYGWANKMVPYIKPEILAINEHERQRGKAHARANMEYTDNYTIIRNKALQRGLEPRTLTQFGPTTPKVGRHYRTRALPAGKWWIIGTHKAPGIKYFWWYPVDIAGDKPERVVLNEANAIYIEGGW
ncbi:MAG: hypothetical protein K2Z81_16395 [Cyanobacteria bacterium]|nr:hypothetical protein [Cyanobacteriota bacterium]